MRLQQGERLREKAGELMNPIEDYYKLIKSGTVTVGKKVRAVYDHIVKNLRHPGTYHYDNELAQHAIDFIETFCRQSKGKYGGRQLRLLPWQKSFVAIIFGFVDADGRRQYNEVFLLIARKNGKTTLAAAIALYALMCDGEHGPEIYSVATVQKQAKIVWEEASRMIRKDPSLRRRCKTLHNDVKCLMNDGLFSPLTRDSGKMDGANPSCVVMDEIHAWTDRNLYDVLKDGMIMREQPLIIITTTAGFVRDNVFDDKYAVCLEVIASYTDDSKKTNERMLPLLYELDDAEEMKKPDCWIKANPSLGGIFTPAKLQEQIDSIHDEISRRDVLTKFFNLPQSGQSAFFELDDVIHRETMDVAALAPRYGIGGIDLSETQDLTCATMLFKVRDDDHFYILQHYWIPEDSVKKHMETDKVPYDIWIAKGYVSTCPGNIIDYHQITQWFVDLQAQYGIYLFKCGYDRWQAPYLSIEMEQQFGKDTMVPVAQGKQTLSIPMQNLKARMQKKQLIYGENPVFEWCCLNVVADQDINGNIQPDKAHSANRIDGFASMLDAYVVYEGDIENYEVTI